MKRRQKNGNGMQSRRAALRRWHREILLPLDVEEGEAAFVRDRVRWSRAHRVPANGGGPGARAQTLITLIFHCCRRGGFLSGNAVERIDGAKEPAWRLANLSAFENGNKRAAHSPFFADMDFSRGL